MSGPALNAAVGAPLLDHVTVRHGTERYWRALKEVMDPELPISVVDMGLIYDIREVGSSGAGRSGADPRAGASETRSGASGTDTGAHPHTEASAPVDSGDVQLTVTMTFTATACPCMSLIEMDIRDRLVAEADVASVEIEVVWDPPWSRRMLTEEGKATLRKYGVAA